MAAYNVYPMVRNEYGTYGWHPTYAPLFESGWPGNPQVFQNGYPPVFNPLTGRWEHNIQLPVVVNANYQYPPGVGIRYAFPGWAGRPSSMIPYLN